MTASVNAGTEIMIRFLALVPVFKEESRDLKMNFLIHKAA
jgi:hypothetical protein